VVLCLLAPVTAPALDLLTFWRMPECPLDLTVGGWVDYHTLTIDQGRRQEDDVRVQVVAADAAGWTLEIVPLAETERGLRPLPGEGWRILLDRAVATRAGKLADHVRRVEQWEGGRRTVMAPEQWRDDPLVQSSLRREFVPDSREEQGPTTRVIGDAELLCRQYALVGADTTSVVLPGGVLLQVQRREIGVAVHPDIPLLGVAYAAERDETVSRFDPPRRRNPPALRRVEVMELVGFGRDARPLLDDR